PLAQEGQFKPYRRLNVGLSEEDPLGSFVFRTTGYNSIRTLTARLSYLQALSRDRLACLPLELRLRGKSTRQSHGTPIFYVDLILHYGTSKTDAQHQATQLTQTLMQAMTDQLVYAPTSRNRT